MYAKIQAELNQIDLAGKAMAAEQQPIYLQKQADLRKKYHEILAAPEKVEEKKDEEKVILSRERQREKDNMKHVLRMTKKEREEEIASLMDRLYYGLDEIPVPEGFRSLVETGNPTMDQVNRYNIVRSMQRHLRGSS